ncbi:uncharacterized protein LOC124434069 [Xenia sp. Carnegie-2017]|nr:uncharacterized protein LOC124434069 [Xenia sp. Carnegie-2017]
MSSSNSDTESTSYQTDDSDWNYYPGIFDIKKTSEASATKDDKSTDDNADVGPYSNEPVADEEWLSNYRGRKQKYDDRLKELQRRLDGEEKYDQWCKCGNC